MSATNRGAVREAFDNYPTPPWCVERLLRYVEIPGPYWLDPCAGAGNLLKTASLGRKDIVPYACEIQPENLPSLSHVVQNRIWAGDFFTFPADQFKGFSAIVTNPPYTDAKKFLERCLPLCPWVVMLLRLNFLGSGRDTFLCNEMPDVYALSNRPSFKKSPKTGKSSTDATEYAWFVWGPERGHRAGKLVILPSLSLAERRAVDRSVLG